MKAIKSMAAILGFGLLAGCASSSLPGSSDSSAKANGASSSIAVIKPFAANTNALALSSQLQGAYAGAQVQVLRVGNEVKVTYPSDLLFGVGGEMLLPSAQAELDPLIHAASVYPQAKLRVDSFTDSSGDAQANLLQSAQRAESVARYLVEGGLAAKNMSLKGYGGSNPVASNSNSEGRALNRRIVITISRVPAPQGAK